MRAPILYLMLAAALSACGGGGGGGDAAPASPPTPSYSVTTKQFSREAAINERSFAMDLIVPIQLHAVPETMALWGEIYATADFLTNAFFQYTTELQLVLQLKHPSLLAPGVYDEV